MRSSENAEMDMKLTYKLLILLGLISLGGCVVVPAGPPGVYAGPQIVAPIPYVAVSPYYSWPRYYSVRRW
jgi:hypothetical protein